MIKAIGKFIDEKPHHAFSYFAAALVVIAVGVMMIQKAAPPQFEPISEVPLKEVMLTSDSCYLVDDKGWIACYSEAMPRAWDNFTDRLICTLDDEGQPATCSLKAKIITRPISCNEISSNIVSCTFPRVP